MSNLSNQQINSSFSGLLQIPGGITSSLQTVQDGNGNPTALSMSSTQVSGITSSSFRASVNNVPVTNSVNRLINDGFGDYISVKDFGAKGDGVTDDTAAIKLALSSGSATIFFPAGYYIISDTLIPQNNQTLLGAGREWGPGTTTLVLVGSVNVPAIKFTSGGTVKNLSISGSATSSTPLQNLIYINNTNGVTVDSVFLVNGYNLIYADGTSFYNTITNVIFYSAYHTQLTVNSDTDNGVDLIISNCRLLSLPSTAMAAMYFNGLGSLVCSNVVVTVAIYIHGTVRQWGTLFFTNCLINGGIGPSIRADYCLGFEVMGGGMGSTSPLGAFYVPAYGSCVNFVFVGVDFEGDAGVSPNRCDGPVTISGSFLGCKWTGSAPFIDYTAASAGNVQRLDVVGGYLGSNSNPVRLTSPATIPGYVLTDGVWTTYTPTFSASSGTFTTASVSGWYKKVGNVIFFTISFTITTNGTASGSVVLSLPTFANISPCVASGKAVGVSNKSLSASCAAGTTGMTVTNYDGTYPGSNGEILNISGSYQIA